MNSLATLNEESWPFLTQEVFRSCVNMHLISFKSGLKSHAVTMFEVGKLSDESLDSLLVELGKVERQVRSQIA